MLWPTSLNKYDYAQCPNNSSGIYSIHTITTSNYLSVDFIFSTYSNKKYTSGKLVPRAVDWWQAIKIRICQTRTIFSDNLKYPLYRFCHKLRNLAKIPNNKLTPVFAANDPEINISLIWNHFKWTRYYLEKGTATFKK
jgi:hypothetical protein